MILKIDIKSKNEINKVTMNHVISLSQPQSIKFNKKKSMRNLRMHFGPNIYVM